MVSPDTVEVGYAVSNVSSHLPRVAVITPVFEDWDCIPRLVDDLAQVDGQAMSLHLLIVDDGSLSISDGHPNIGNRELSSIRLVSLSKNLGHQRAIAVGLCCVSEEATFDAVVVMDSDGEDRPGAIRQLWQEHLASPNAIVVAERRRRTEAVKFRFFYRLYRVAFRLLTGQRLDFGNFVLIPGGVVTRLTAMNELWNHFPATIMRSRIPVMRVPTDRGLRYSGTSKMNFTALVNHGLAGISAFVDSVFVRLLVATIVCLGGVIIAGATVIGVRILDVWGVPGWATTVLGLLALGILQLIGLLTLLTFLTLSMRSAYEPPPSHFAVQYVNRSVQMS